MCSHLKVIPNTRHMHIITTYTISHLTIIPANKHIIIAHIISHLTIVRTTNAFHNFADAADFLLQQKCQGPNTSTRAPTAQQQNRNTTVMVVKIFVFADYSSLA